MFDAPRRDERMLLLRSVCALAGADLEITPSERGFVERLVTGPALDIDDAAEVDAYLHVGPPPRCPSPGAPSSPSAGDPLEHRRAFVESMHGVSCADDRVDRGEREQRKQLEEIRAALSN